MQKWKINNHELIYDDITHIYFVDNIRCISVSQYLKTIFPNKYSGVDEYILNKAAEKGNTLHKMIEIYETIGLPSDNIKEFRDYLFLKKYYNFNVIGNEVPVIIPYNDTFICGRLDLVIIENENKGLADIKCTSILDKEWLTLQLNLYKIGYEYSYNENISFLRGIHLKNGKRKYVEIKMFENIFEEIQKINKVNNYGFNNDTFPASR